MADTEAFYRDLVHNLPDGFARHRLLTDADGKPIDYIFLDVNPAFETLTGLTRERLIGRRVTEALPGIERSGFDWIGVYGRVAQGNPSASFEQYSQPLGRWYEVTVYSDEPGHFTTIFHDITARRNTEYALREGEARYRSLFEHSMDAIYIGTPDGRVVDVNQAWLDLFGYSRDDLPGLRAEDFYASPSDRGDFTRRMAETGFVQDVVRYKRKDGTDFDCQRMQVALKDKSGQVVAFQGINRDVSQLTRAEKALRASEQRFRSLFEQSLDAIYVAAPDGSSLAANQAWLDLFGYTREELLGQRPTDLLLDDANRPILLGQLERRRRGEDLSLIHI